MEGNKIKLDLSIGREWMENPNHTKYAEKLVKKKPDLTVVKDIEISGRCFNGSDFVENDKFLNRETFMIKKSRKQSKEEKRKNAKFEKKLRKMSRKIKNHEFDFSGDTVEFNDQFTKGCRILHQGGIADATNFLFDFFVMINNIYHNPTFVGYITNIVSFLKQRMTNPSNLFQYEYVKSFVIHKIDEFCDIFYGPSDGDIQSFIHWYVDRPIQQIPRFPKFNSIFLKDHYLKWIQYFKIHEEKYSDLIDMERILAIEQMLTLDEYSFIVNLFTTNTPSPIDVFERCKEHYGENWDDENFISSFFKVFYNYYAFEDNFMKRKFSDTSYFDEEVKLDDDFELQGPDLKESLYNDAIKLLFRNDTKLFENSEFGRTSKSVLSSLTLSPILLLTGKISSLKQYDEWYEKNLKFLDITGTMTHHILTWFYHLLSSGIPYFISGDATFLHPITKFEKWSELCTVIIQELSDKQMLHDIAMKYEKVQILKLIYMMIRTGRELSLSFVTNSIVVGECKSICVKLYRLLPNINAKYRSMELRSAPMGILITGGAGIGKSHIAQQVLATCASCLGIDASKQVYNINAADKYMSGYIGENLGYVDDVGGGVANVNPDGFIMNSLQYFNEFNTPTIQADVDDKGKIFNEMKVIVATSNEFDMNVGAYLRNKDAALRRFGFIIAPKLKPEYKDNSGSNFKMTTDDIDITQTHTFNIYKYIVGATGAKTDTGYTDYEFVKNEFGAVIENMSTEKMLRTVKHHFDQHIIKANKSKQRTHNILTSKWCEIHGMLENYCGCEIERQLMCKDEHSLPTEIMFDIRNFNFSMFSEVKDVSNVVRSLVSIMEDEKGKIAEDKITIWSTIKKAKDIKKKKMVLQGKFFNRFKSFLFSPIKSCVVSVVNDDVIQSTINQAFARGAQNVANTLTQQGPVDIAMDNLSGNTNLSTSISSAIEHYKKSILNDIYSKMSIFGGIVLAFLSIYGTIRMFTSSQSMIEQAGFFTRIPSEGHLSKFSSVDTQLGALMRKEPYFKTERVPTHPAMTPLSMRPIELNKTESNVNKLTDTNLYKLTVQYLDKNVSGKGYGVVLGGNIFVFPKHYLFDTTENKYVFDIKLIFENPFVTTVSHAYNKKSIYLVPDRDLAVVYFPDLLHFKLTAIMPKENIITSEAILLYPNREKVINLSAYNPVDCVLTAKVQEYRKNSYISYRTEFDTITGDCGLPIVSLGKYSGIVGLHSGINPNDRSEKYLTRLYDTDFELFSKELLKLTKEAPMLSLPSEGINLQGAVVELSSKSRLRYFQGYGFPIGTMKNIHAPRLKSKLRKSLFAEDTGLLLTHKIPEFKSFTREREDGEKEFVDPIIRKLTATEESPRNINPALIDAAKDTFSRVIDNWVDWNEVRPSSFSDIMNGQPGTISNSLNLSTSPGYGYSGKFKRDYVYELQSDPLNRVFDERILNDVLETLRSYSKGETSFAISKWFAKDEAIKITKEQEGKQRFVSCSPFKKLLVSKMVLKDLFLQMRQKGKSHMCVGMNAASYSWGTIPEAFAKLDPKFERIMDGDYSSYDAIVFLLKIVLSIILIKLENNKYFRVPIVFELDDEKFSIDAYTILLCLISDLHAYPVMVGLDLAFFFGIIESGADHTAELNSLMESFLHILIYLFCYLLLVKEVEEPKESIDIYNICMGSPPFEDNVVLRNYGDDSIDTCSTDVAHFYSPENRGRAASILGFPITDARKNKTLSYVPLKDATFLKRRFIWNEEAKAYFAPLEEESILKIITFIKTTNCTLEEGSINAICDAERQYFLHGREVYDKQVAWMKTLVESKKELVGITIPWVTYDVLLQDFKNKTLSMGSL